MPSDPPMSDLKPAARGNDAERCSCGGARYHGGYCFSCGRGPGGANEAPKETSVALDKLVGDAMSEKRLKDGYNMIYDEYTEDTNKETK